MEFRKIFLLVLILKNGVCEDVVCDRRPLGTKMEPLPPDNRFYIEILDIRDDNLYLPHNKYTVRLRSRDDKSTFIAFTIFLKEEVLPNLTNPRKPFRYRPGTLEPPPNSTLAIFNRNCNNTLVESDITAKTSVDAIWTAPPKDNQCVTIYAVVAVNRDVWYSFEGPLSKRMCEDRRKADDKPPMENDDCRARSEARYQVTFEGMWSYNTHPYIYPKAQELARFSDIVGASHSTDFTLYKYNSEASEGLKMLAEQGNTTKLEMEIQQALGKNGGVRTIIKATGPPMPNMTTVAHFRVSPTHHFVSLVTAILPSPDWFLGVANFELCDVTTGDWARNLKLNLYPLDAGTDTGLTFESSNEPSARQPISKQASNEDIPKEQIKPMAKLRFDLVRTYNISDIADGTDEGEGGGEGYSDGDGEGNGDGNGDDGGEGEDEGAGNGNGGAEDAGEGGQNNKEENKDKSEESGGEGGEAPQAGEATTECTACEVCNVTQWEYWPCEGMCVDGTRSGYRVRQRYHIVDGVVVGKYFRKGRPIHNKVVSEYCLNKYPRTETLECTETCEETTTQSEDAEEDYE